MFVAFRQQPYEFFVREALESDLINKICKALVHPSRKSKETVQMLINLLTFFSGFKSINSFLLESNVVELALQIMKAANANNDEALLASTMVLLSSVCTSQQSLNQLVKLNGIQDMVEMAKEHPCLAAPFIGFVRTSFKFQSMIEPFKKQGITVDNLAVICDYVDLDEGTSASTSLIVKHIASLDECKALTGTLAEGNLADLKKMNVLILNEEYVDLFHKAESIEVLLQKTADIIENEEIESKADNLRLCLKGLTLFGKAGYVRPIERLGGVSIVGNALTTRNVPTIHYAMISLADQLTSLASLNEEDEEDYCLIFKRAQGFLKGHQNHIGIIKHSLIVAETLAPNEEIGKIAVEMKTDQLVMELLKKFSGVPEIVELSFKLLAAILTDEDQVIKFASEENMKTLLSIGQENIRFINVCFPLVEIFDTIVTLPECRSLILKDSLLMALARIILGKNDLEKVEFEQALTLSHAPMGQNAQNQNASTLYSEMRALGKDIFLQLFEVKELKERHCANVVKESKKASIDSDEMLLNQLILRVVTFSLEVSTLFTENKLPEVLLKELLPKASKEAFLKNQWEIIEESLLMTTDFYTFASDKKRLQGLVSSHIFFLDYLKMFEKVISTNRFQFNLWKLIKVLSSTMTSLESSNLALFVSNNLQITTMVLECLMKNLVKFQDNSKIFTPLISLLIQFARTSPSLIDKMMKLKLSKTICAKLSDEEPSVTETLACLSFLKLICEESEASCKTLDEDKCLDILIGLKSKHQDTKVIMAIAEVIKLLMRATSQTQTVENYVRKCIKMLQEKMENEEKMTAEKVQLLSDIHGFLNLDWVSPLIASSGLIKLLVQAVKHPEPSELTFEDHDFTNHALGILIQSSDIKNQIDAKSFIQWGLKFLQAGPSELFQKVLKLIRRLLEENIELAHEFNNEKVAELFVVLQKDLSMANDVDQIIGLVSTVCPEFIKYFDYDRSIRQIISKTNNHLDKKEKESLVKCLHLLEGISKIPNAAELLMKHGILVLCHRILDEETEPKLEKAGKDKKEDLKLYEISLSTKSQQWFQEVNYVFTILGNVLGNIKSPSQFKTGKLSAVLNLVSWIGITNASLGMSGLEIFSKMSGNEAALSDFNEENLIDLVMSVLNAHPYSTDHLAKGAEVLEEQGVASMIKEVSESVDGTLQELDVSDEESQASLRQAITYLSNLILCDHAKKNKNVYRSLCKSLEKGFDKISQLQGNSKLLVEVPILFLLKRIALVNKELRGVMGKKIISYIATKALNLVDMGKYPLLVELTSETVIEILSLDEEILNCLSGETGERITLVEESVSAFNATTERHIEGLLDMADSGNLPKSTVLQLMELFSRKNEKIVQVITTGKNFSRIIQLVKEVEGSDQKAYLRGIRALSRLLHGSDSLKEINDEDAEVIQNILTNSRIGALGLQIGQAQILSQSEILKSEMLFVQSALNYSDTNPDLVKESIILNIYYLFCSLNSGPFEGEIGSVLFIALDVLSKAFGLSPTIGMMVNEKPVEELQKLLQTIEKSLPNKVKGPSETTSSEEEEIVGSSELPWQILEAGACCIGALTSHPRCAKNIACLSDVEEGEKLEETLINLTHQTCSDPFIVTKTMLAVMNCLENNKSIAVKHDNPKLANYEKVTSWLNLVEKYPYCKRLGDKIKGSLGLMLKQGGIPKKRDSVVFDGLLKQVLLSMEPAVEKKGIEEEMKTFVRKKTVDFEMGEFLKQLDTVTSVFEDLVLKVEKNEIKEAEFNRLMMIIQGTGIISTKQPENCLRLVRIGAHYSILRLLDRAETPKAIRNECLITLRKLLENPLIYAKLKGAYVVVSALVKNLSIAEDDVAIGNIGTSLEIMAENEPNIKEIEKINGSDAILAAFKKTNDHAAKGQLLLALGALMNTQKSVSSLKEKDIFTPIEEITKEEFDSLSMYRALAFMVGRLSNDETTQERLGSPELVETLKRGCEKYPDDEKLLINSSFGLANLCYNHPKNSSGVQKAGLIDHLVRNLGSGVITDRIIEQGAILISNLSFRNNEMKKIFGEIGICKILVQLLKRYNEFEIKNDPKREKSLNFLLKAVANIASFPENAKLFYKEGYLEEVTRTIRTQRGNSSILRFAIAGVGNIFHRLSDQDHLAIVKSPLLAEMDAVINQYQNSQEMITITAESLCFLTKRKEISLEMTNRTKVLEVFLKCLYDHDHEVPLVEQITRIFDHMTESNTICQKLIAMNPLEIFVTLSKLHNSDKNILPHLLRIMIRLTPDKKSAEQLHELGFSTEAFRIYDPELLKDDIKNFFILLLKIAMFEDSSEVLAQTGASQLIQAAEKNIDNPKTIQVLVNLFAAFSDSQRCHPYLLSSGIVPIIKKVVAKYPEDSQVQHNAIDVLMNIAEESPESREIMKSENIEEAFETIQEKSAKDIQDKIVVIKKLVTEKEEGGQVIEENVRGDRETNPNKKKMIGGQILVETEGSMTENVGLRGDRDTNPQKAQLKQKAALGNVIVTAASQIRLRPLIPNQGYYGNQVSYVNPGQFPSDPLIPPVYSYYDPANPQGSVVDPMENPSAFYGSGGTAIVTTTTTTNYSHPDYIAPVMGAMTIQERIAQVIPPEHLNLMSMGSVVAFYRDNGTTKDKRCMFSIENLEIIFFKKRSKKPKIKSKYLLPVRSISQIQLGYAVHSPFLRKASVYGKSNIHFHLNLSDVLDELSRPTKPIMLHDD